MANQDGVNIQPESTGPKIATHTRIDPANTTFCPAEATSPTTGGEVETQDMIPVDPDGNYVPGLSASWGKKVLGILERSTALIKAVKSLKTELFPQGVVGAATQLLDGKSSSLRLGSHRDLITSSLAPPNGEASLRGQIFTSTSWSTGYSSGTTIPSSFSTSSYPFCIWNPPSSKRVASILAAHAYPTASSSATVSAGIIYLCMTRQQTYLSPNVGQIICLNSLNNDVGVTPSPLNSVLLTSVSSMLTFSQSGTLDEAPSITTPIQPPSMIGPAFFLCTTVPYLFPNTLNIDGRITLYPGYCLSFQSNTTSSQTFIAEMGFTWREFDLV